MALKQVIAGADEILPPPRVMAPLNQDKFPQVRFWHASDWKKFSDNEKGVSGGDEVKSEGETQNTAQRYIEDNDGIAVDGERARIIRNIAHQLFFDLRNYKKTQPKWGECGLAASEWFNCELAYHVPEMRLCSGHWKAHKLAGYLYSSWQKTHGASKPVTIKDEVMGDAEVGDVGIGGIGVPGPVMNPAIKRSRDEHSPTKKRARNERRKKVDASPLTVQISKSAS